MKISARWVGLWAPFISMVVLWAIYLGAKDWLGVSNGTALAGGAAFIFALILFLTEHANIYIEDCEKYTAEEVLDTLVISAICVASAYGLMGVFTASMVPTGALLGITLALVILMLMSSLTPQVDLYLFSPNLLSIMALVAGVSIDLSGQRIMSILIFVVVLVLQFLISIERFFPDKRSGS